jgi:glyoxylase-like metal-dependent hydrolase (beta-lactamase superfamily II)
LKQEIIRISLDGVNCYLGKQENKFVLFDTGGHLNMDKIFDNRGKRLKSELENNGCTRDNLTLIVLTHGDSDHTANANYLRNEFHAQIAMHEGDLPLVDNPTVEKALDNFKFQSLLYKFMSLFIKKTIVKVTQKVLDDFQTFKPDIFVSDGYSLTEYGFDATILHIPGHTLGSIGILTASGDLISGDTLANVKKPGPAPNALNFKQLSQSITRLSTMNIRMVYPGHGDPFPMQKLLSEKRYE